MKEGGYNMKGVAILMVATMMAVMLVAEVRVANAACAPTALAPCLGAITSSQPPSAACCNRLREQKPCLCGYIKDPNLKKYVNSPGAKKTASACGVTIQC